jgi:hypothetical protein
MKELRESEVVVAPPSRSAPSPLAMCYVPPRTPTRSCAALALSLDALGTGTTDLPERQWTLRATVDWSVGLLDDAEWSLLEAVAVFVDGWTVLDRRIRRYIQPDVLIVDELRDLPSDHRAADLLDNVVSRRHEKRSTMSS